MQDKDHKHPPADLLKEWSFEVNGAHNTNWFDRASRLTAVLIAAPFLAEPAKRTGRWHVMERFMVPMMDRHLSSVQKRCRARGVPGRARAAPYSDIPARAGWGRGWCGCGKRQSAGSGERGTI
jgi:hypothetical protein